MEIDEMVTSVIHSGLAISDVIGERDLGEWPGVDECIKHLLVQAMW